MSDRTLGDIINAVRDGEKPDYDDLRYAICAMEALRTFDSMAMRKLVEAEQEGKKAVLVHSAEFQYKKLFELNKRAMNRTPKEFVGWDNDPDNPEFLKRRGVSKKLWEKVTKDHRDG